MTEADSGKPARGGFAPPEGFLDGDDFEIASRWIGGREKDYDWQLEHSPVANPVAIADSMTVLEGYRKRLLGRDERLAQSLARLAVEEVADLLKGRRLVVSGQAHLLGERALQAQSDKN